MNRRRATLGLVILMVLCSELLYLLRFEVRTAGAENVSNMLTLLRNKNPFRTINIQQSPEVLIIPEDAELMTMDMLSLEVIYMRYVENVQQACGITQHMGAEDDGGYNICEKYLEKNNCLVYSFGSRRMFEFEDDIEKTYGCEIHTFDPFDGQKDHQHSPKVTFHKLGLGDKDTGPLLTLTSVKKKLNHTNMMHFVQV